MNRKMITHGLVITAVVFSIFVLAALTPVRSYTKTSDSLAAVSIAKIDHSMVSGTDIRMISDKEIPLAETPIEGVNVSLWLIFVSVAAVMSGVVIYKDYKDETKI